MSVYKDKKRCCFIFEFDRFIDGRRVRARKQLPKTWTQAQADGFDRQETARLYAIATEVERTRHTIEGAVARYLEGRIPDLKSGREIAGELALMFWAYEGKPLAALADVCKEYSAKNSDLAPATLCKRIRYLTSACRWAWKHYSMGEIDPGQRVTVPTVRNERQVYIGRRQMLMLAKACTHRPTRAAIRIAFYSGMRLSEIERADRCFDRGIFILHDTKNGEPRIVPMHPRIRVCADYAQSTRFITSYHFRAARDVAGLVFLHFHDLRHSAASAMINEGADLYTVGAVLGHRSAASTARYAHLSTGRLTDAIALIGQKIPHRGNKKAA